MRHLIRILPLTAALTAFAAEGPFLHPLFSDHAVLQRDKELPVWGWSTPGDQVTVTFADRIATGTAGSDGRWQVSFTAVPAGGPFTLNATSAAKNTTVSDVLVGDVWLCSGQSNMEMPVSSSQDAAQEMAAADFPRIRQFTGTKRFSLAPQQITGGGWAVCNPNTVGNFTAVGYYFGRDLHRETQVPIGLMHASWGGTRIASWLSRESLSQYERARGDLDQLTNALAGLDDGYERRMARWWEAVDPLPGAQAPGLDDSGWKAMDLPGNWEQRGLEGFDGVVWLRLHVDLPADLAGHEAKLLLGPIDDRDVTWINGTEIGRTETWNHPRVYPVAKDLLKAGTNVIALRVLDTGGAGGVYGAPEEMRLEIGDRAVPLAGAWRYAPGKPLSEIPPMPARLDHPNVVTSLSNGMIEPLVPAALRGAIWYQGETDANMNSGYDQLLPLLIADWRRRFAFPDMPFGIVQLPNFSPVVADPVQDSGWTMVREAQLLTFLTIPHTGLAVTTDLGEAMDIHPRNKQGIGHRLASWALHDVYQRDDQQRCGPVFHSATPEGAALRVSFRYVTGGLAAHGELKGFAIAGESGPWLAAEARIEGETVVVSHPDVPQPVKVRYAWATNPACTLFSGSGLPTAPFRSDGPLANLLNVP